MSGWTLSVEKQLGLGQVDLKKVSNWVQPKNVPNKPKPKSGQVGLLGRTAQK